MDLSSLSDPRSLLFCVRWWDNFCLMLMLELILAHITFILLLPVQYLTTNENLCSHPDSPLITRGCRDAFWTERKYGNTLAMIGYCCWWTLWLRVVFVWMMCLSGYACRVPMICGCQINYFMWLMWLCGCRGWKSILLYVCLSPNFPLCIQVGEAWCTKSGKKTGSPTSSAPYMTFAFAHIWAWIKSNLMFVIFLHNRNLRPRNFTLESV